MTHQWKFGTRADGRPISAYRLTSETGFQAVILDQGAILQKFSLPNGRNIALGFESWAEYERDTGYIGRIIGPSANRIAGAKFQIDENECHLMANDGPHNLHSGPNGFDVQMWNVLRTEIGLRLNIESPEELHGFPGTVKATLNISLVENKLRLEMTATSDRPTPLNLTWHPYWNLSASNRIDGHDLRVESETRSKFKDSQEFSVKDTLYDFRKPLPLGSVQLDSNYKNVKSAQLIADQATMTVTSSLPDMQIYTGDALAQPRTGIALEPQFQPNDINLAQESLIRPGETYNHWIEYCFDLA